MEDDDTAGNLTAAELEEELYSRIHHDKPDAHEIVSEAHRENIQQLKKPPTFHQNRSVTKHSIVNNSKANKKMSTKNRKKPIEKCNPNPFAIASAINSQIQVPKRFTPYTSYLSQVDSKPIDPPAAMISNSTKVEHNENDQRPNPFNCGFNRAEEKMKRLQLMQAKKAQANKIRDNIQHFRNIAIDEMKKDTDNYIDEGNVADAIHVPDSDSDDEVYIYPPEEPTVISSDDEDNANVNEVTEKVDSLQDDCDDIHVDYETRLSRHDDPFGGIDVAELSSIVLENPSTDVQPVNDLTDHFAKPQRANRQKRSYEVSETDFAHTDVYESESSDLPECNVRDNAHQLATILSESEGNDIDTTNRSKRMRKRKSSGSNRGSDCFSSDDSDADNDVIVEHEKPNRTYLFRGEGVYNAITKFPKRTIDTQRKPNPDIDVEADDSSDDSLVNDEVVEQGNWTVTDQVGEPDNIELDLSIIENCHDAGVDNEDKNESNVDKDDDNSVRSKPLVVHPEMGWNKEMKAFYNDSWGGETHNAKAIRREMPNGSFEWPINPRDLRENYNILKQPKCHNCRENGHRQAYCPQPKKEVICYTCGEAGHREVRCPHAICLKCGEKTNTYRRGCERCFRMSHVNCRKCRGRGHMARDCPDNWRAYHNTTDSVSTPARLPINNPPKRYCSACAAYGHRADQCYNFRMYLQDDVTSSDIKKYEKTYFDDAPIDNSMSTPYSMFENPRESFAFKWNVNEGSDRIYGRFLEATKVQRDTINKEAKTKRQKNVKIPSPINVIVEEPLKKLFLNPMNAENIREKPKKQFSKNFYEESTAARAHTEESSQQIATYNESATGNETSAETNTVENVDQCNDVEMKDDDVEGSKIVSNDTSKESNIDPLDAFKMMEETIEVDPFRATNIFSFTKELEVLEKSKFDLSFIGSLPDDNQEVDNNSSTSKSKERKIRNEAEIERLTEMEISLNKLKKELSKKKPNNDDIVLNITNSTDHSIHTVHDSDSNYSFGEYFNESKAKERVNESVEEEPKNVYKALTIVEKGTDNAETESPDYIPLPPNIDDSDMMEESYALRDPPDRSASEAKIFLTKEHARLLLSTEAGNKLLSDASITHQVKVRMDWENLGNVLVVIGSKLNQNKFHADLIRFLVEVCKKMRLRNETFQQIPRSKVALIRFIREQFALLEQPLGNPSELYKNMRRNEKLQSKNGMKNADRARKNLNIILMGRAGLRDGGFHLAELQRNLKFLLDNTKDMMTKQTREEIYQHYRYVFSPYEHDDYPELIKKYEELKKSKKFPSLHFDKSLFELKINVSDSESVELNRAKQKLMLLSNPTESPNINKEPTEQQATIVMNQEPKTPTRELKSQKREPKTPKHQQPKSPKPENTPKVQFRNVENTDVPPRSAVEGPSNVHQNAIWSLKCKDIVEKCRQKHIKSSKVVDKLNSVLERAANNQLSYADYKNLEKILNTLNRTVN